MRLRSLLCIGYLLLIPAFVFAEPAAKTEPAAKKAKEPKVETKAERHENHTTIELQTGRGDRYTERKNFCGKDADTSTKLCQTWLKEQKATLGSKVLTSTCEQPLFLYGKEKDNCNAYLSHGEITYLIK